MLLFFLFILFGLALIGIIVKLPVKLGKNIGIVIGITAILLLVYRGNLRRNINIGFGNILIGEMLLMLLAVLFFITLVIHIVWKLLKLPVTKRKTTFIVIAGITLVWLIGYEVYQFCF